MQAQRVSIINDHNRYEQTDRLYDPLREALNKRTNSAQKNKRFLLNPNSIKQVQQSSVSHRLCELSPDQASLMQKTIFIPTDKQLIPTNERQKILGKKFVAVDVNVHYAQPITQPEFKKIYHPNGHPPKQTIYAIGQEPTVRPTLLSLQKSQPLIRQSHPLSSLQSMPQKLTAETIQSQNNQGLANLKKQPSTKKSRYSTYKKQSMKRSKKHRTQSQYKYNLFSALDQGTNTKCNKCWVGNEVIASKPEREPWA